MKFGPVPLSEAEGAILAHSIALAGCRLRKGQRLDAADIAALAAAGHKDIIAARLEPGDVHEDAAAWRLAAAVAGASSPLPEDAAVTALARARGLRLEPPFTGRVNLRAEAAGVLVVDAGAVDAVNAVDPLLTFATAAPWARVRAGQMVATVKVIAYAVAGANLAEAERRARGALRVAPFRPGTAALVQTAVPGQAPALHRKGRAVTEARLAPLGWRLVADEVVPHELG
ncbi:MAG: molybdopterin biosynthesis protein, partial [Alphaproteobacteria bacterium]